MTEEIADVIGAIAAAFVGTIILDMWLGGGLLAGLSPANFPAFSGTPAPTTGGTTTTPSGAATSTATGGSGPTTGGIASANI